MRVKKVNRYYCDFCKKAGCAANHMKKHEERCTMNPNRHCGMCAMIGNTQPDLSMLVSIVNKNTKGIASTSEPECLDDDWTEKYETAMNKAIDELYKITECPACIHAALKQSGNYFHKFDFKQECQKFWQAFNESQLEEGYY